ncbi:Hypothetical protein R9X50_00459400 [Acrodontium crateriforme]|uniref:Uncharacterized protein n=1 Tax=Acrodontium crateriforme TaxID=150365 RepID=A0AAQ3MB86_9PEZI|nr:Hypothetical protein R9X50_00459400 [Acrodontium crateriforme]
MTHSSEQRQYRPVKPLAPEILGQVTLYLEQRLYQQGFSLLFSTLTAGTGYPSVAAHIPSLQHLVFASTLIVHPSVTTRTNAADRHAGANDALKYLRHVNELVGPRSSGLVTALRFANAGGFRASRRARLPPNDVAGEDDDELSKINSPLMEDSIWAKAEDFWSVVGWAFNCSVAHSERWKRWEVWLGLMVDILEADLAIAAETNDGENCLLSAYLSPFVNQGRSNKRRLMRALLADGSPKSLAEFGEVWKNETKLAKKKDEKAEMLQMRKRKKLDLDKEEYADYLDSDSENDGISTSKSQSRRPSLPLEDGDIEEEEDEPEGDQKDNSLTRLSSSIPLRQRFLALLSQYTTQHPALFLPPDELYDLYTEFTRPLPLPIFQLLILPAKRFLPPTSQISLTQTLLCALLATPGPPCQPQHLTQEIWQAKYALATATNSGAGDNAKLSLLIEDLLSALSKAGALKPGPEVLGFVTEGVLARETKAGFDARRKTGDKAKDEVEATKILKLSGVRMKTLVQML